MDDLLKKILNASGISGHEHDIAEIMQQELRKTCQDVQVDSFGNVIARKGSGGKKIMLAAHMDEIGLLVKYVSKDGFIYFIKIGGIDDRVLVGQRVVIKAQGGDIFGIIGTKPPHLQKDEERKKPIKYEDMFIDIGSRSREETLQRVAIGDPVIFEPNAGVLNGRLCYGKAVDNRIGCYALLKIMEKLSVDAEVYAVATAQEEVGLKGAKTSSFRVNPDYAIAIDTTLAGDMPQIKELESSLKLGEGVAVTIIEASGRGVIVPERVRKIILQTAKENKIKYQMDVIEGGMTDGAMIYMNREGVPTGVLSIPTRYIHAPTGVFSMDDLDSAVELCAKVVETFARS
jgi:endoglucanase